MKIYKFISKGLVLGFLLNSASILSYATTEIPNRYQTLEGEYISIDNPTESSIEDIEVFGNTVQDPNNLENIQSVGDLYVDDDGSPILDNQGREQYKIEIESVNKNLFNPNMNVLDNHYIADDGTIKTISGYSVGMDYIRVLPSTTYICENTNYVAYYDINKNFIKREPSYGFQEFTTPSNCYYVRFQIEWSRLEDKNLSLHRFAEGTRTNRYKIPQYQSDNTVILLPCQLMKVGDVADRLYWDNLKDRYVIEKNVAPQSMFKNLNIVDKVYNDTHYNFSFTKPDEVKNTNGVVFATGLKGDAWIWGNYTKEGIRMINTVILCIHKNKIDEWNDTSLTEYLNSIDIYALLKTPQLIETNITKQIKLTTYSDKTYISTVSENGIKPTLKVTIDRIEEVSQEVVNIALSNPTSSNLALARMYVNMLPESLYKDHLQEQLNQLFTTNMVLEKKNTTANVDLYIKCENMLLMSLDTNSITFEDFSGVTDMEKANAVNITVTSSLPYQLNAYLPVEIQSPDKLNTMDKNILNIKENSEVEYKTFTNTIDKVVLKDNCIAGNDINHGIDIKLKGSIAHEKDVYKTTIKFEVQQK